MKKTIIVACIAAVAAVAQAGNTTSVIDEATVPVYNSGAVDGMAVSPSATNIDLGFAYDSDKTFTAVFTLDPRVLQSTFAGTDTVALASISTETETGSGMNWSVVATSTGLTLKDEAYGDFSQGVHNVSTDTAAGASTINLSTGMDSADWTGVVKAALSLCYTGSSTLLFLNLIDTDGNVTTYGGSNTGFKTGTTTAPDALTVNSNLVTSAYVFDNTMQGGSDDRISLATQAAERVAAVPEPATATLSLLALAGLAARRRRK